MTLPARTLESARLRIRQRALGDSAKCFQLIENNRKHLSKWLPWVESHLSVEDSVKYFSECIERFRKAEEFDYSLFLNSYQDQMIGSIGIHTIRWQNRSCSLGYWLGQEFEGQGYISEAIRALEDQVLRPFFHRVCIQCDSRNISSIAVAQRNNYVLESRRRDEKFDSLKYQDELEFVKIFNPQKAGVWTEGLPDGYSLKVCEEDEIQSDKDQMVQLLYQGKIAGGCRFAISEFQRVQLKESFIHLEHQGRGLYPDLLKFLIKFCRTQGFSAIDCLQPVSETRALIAKLKLGFQLKELNSISNQARLKLNLFP